MSFLKNIFLIFLVIFLSSSLIRNIIDYQKKIGFFNDYRAAVDKEKKKKLTLQTEILKKSDPYELEKTIRNKLNLTRPDELVVILPRPSLPPTVVAPAPKPNWQLWLDLFR